MQGLQRKTLKWILKADSTNVITNGASYLSANINEAENNVKFTCARLGASYTFLPIWVIPIHVHVHVHLSSS